MKTLKIIESFEELTSSLQAGELYTIQLTPISFYHYYCYTTDVESLVTIKKQILLRGKETFIYFGFSTITESLIFLDFARNLLLYFYTNFNFNRNLRLFYELLCYSYSHKKIKFISTTDDIVVCSYA